MASLESNEERQGYQENRIECYYCGDDDFSIDCDMEWCEECGKPYCPQHIEEGVCDYCLLHEY